ncbi:hypothetical protein [Erythrobacter colymbi]|uniref:hypothetical protein n=1 Tax=Erythrobacter colymbi TaxID=1161202 RepID=UPI000A3ADC97|nr:hypothetical protein [Erythrobacter colymbi]
MSFVEANTPSAPGIGTRIGQGCLALLVLLVGSCTAVDYGSRYASWAGLSKAEVVAAADAYVREYAPGQKACLYRVSCDGGRARLVLVKDVAALDVEALRQIAWDRRFYDVCPGYTANLGLAVVEGALPEDAAAREAVWSFYRDRFVRTMQSNGPPLAFSEQPAEPCTAEFAVAG